MNIQIHQILDAKGLACPMPIVRTKKALEQMASGQVLEVQATDQGSLADIRSWAKARGHQYLGSTEEGEVLHHFIRKSDPSEVKEERKFPHAVTNNELEQCLREKPLTNVLDVREPAEYAFGHIPGAVSIPLGELEQRIGELNAHEELYIVCRTGSRSDMAAHLLERQGFKHIRNVLPGMSAWTGPLEKSAGI
ncbi:sulfurtransferase TusA family protein [Paenibacillus sp. RC84]|uniref:sulfurtransferase TusA family protein n=1 Tax=Paenibacillus sp. RC84 TaxID=3156252 RepID=UPI003515370F